MSHLNPTSPLIEPPSSEIMSFESFQNIITSTNLDEIYKYYDSDGSVDLENTYDGSSDSDLDINSDSPSHSTTESPRLLPDTTNIEAEIRDAERQDRASKSRHNDKKLQDLIYNTQVVLEQLSIAAQSILEEQPLSTRVILANSAVGFFERYGSHGSMFRFSEDVGRFLDGGERVRRPGVDGRDPKKDAILKFAPLKPGQKDGAEKGKKKGSKRKDSAGEHGKGLRKGRKVEDGSTVATVKISNDEMQAVVADVGTGKQLGDSDRYRNIRPKPVPPPIQTGLSQLLSSGMPTGRPIGIPASPSSALARFSLNSPIPVTTPQSAASTNRHAYSCTIHPSLNAHLATQPYDPISLEFTWPATSRQNGNSSMPTPGILDAFNNIVHLFNAEGRFMLSYYVRKFDTPIEVGGTGRPNSRNDYAQNVEPPHALFRLGIAQYLWGKIGKVVDNKQVDDLGLTPETRRLLGEVWERHPSTAAWWQDSLPSSQKSSNATVTNNNGTIVTEEDLYAHESDFDPNVSDDDVIHTRDSEAVRRRKLKRKMARADRKQKRDELEKKKRQMALGGLNPWEKIILARATNISIETIDAFWDDMREKTKAWGAMKMWCAAMEGKMIKKAKVEGRW